MKNINLPEQVFEWYWLKLTKSIKKLIIKEYIPEDEEDLNNLIIGYYCEENIC